MQRQKKQNKLATGLGKHSRVSVVSASLASVARVVASLGRRRRALSVETLLRRRRRRLLLVPAVALLHHRRLRALVVRAAV